jgi:hypothetical protein
MDRKIIIYGMTTFSDADELKRYIKVDVFLRDGSRFDYSQRKDADVIVLSLNGNAYGHFDIASKDKPTDKELRTAPTTKAVYIVKRPAILYETPVPVLPLGIKRFRFGRKLSERQFQQIQALARNPSAL